MKILNTLRRFNSDKLKRVRSPQISSFWTRIAMGLVFVLCTALNVVNAQSFDFEANDVGDEYPMFRYGQDGGAGNIIEVVPDPDGESGNVLLIHGTNPHADYGPTGVHLVPEFEVVLPAGKKLGDYKYLKLDMRFTSGTDNGGTNAAGTGWAGWGTIINIDGGLVLQRPKVVDGEVTEEMEDYFDIQAGYGNARALGSKALGLPGENDWQPNTWARGIILSLANLKMPAEYKALTEFKLRVGTQSGAVKCWMDNVKLVEVQTSLDFEANDVGDEYPMFRYGQSSVEGNIIEVVPDPDEESGNVLLIHGTNPHADYGPTGVHLVPEFEIVLPAGKTLGDYKYLKLDMRFTSGIDNGGTNAAGTGWAGWGTIINIDGGIVLQRPKVVDGEVTEEMEDYFDIQAGYGNARALGSKALGLPGENDWQPNIWARGIIMPLANLKMPDEYKALTEFKLRVGSQSGAVKCWMDNVTLVEARTSLDFEANYLGDEYPMYRYGQGGGAGNIIEVVSDPDGESGNVLLIHGTNPHADYGPTGVHLVPEFEIVLPAGKTLGDYESLKLDMRFTSGIDNGGTNAAGTGWAGWGTIINIDGGLVLQRPKVVDGEETEEMEDYFDIQAGYGNARALGSQALGLPGENDWQPNTWARGIIMPLANLKMPAEYKELTEFKLRVGSQSGAIKCWMDNVILVEAPDIPSFDFEAFKLGDKFRLYATGGNEEQQSKNIAEVVLDPEEDMENNSGQVLLLHGTNWHDGYGYTGVQAVPEFDFVLPKGKTLGDYESVKIDMRFISGTENGGTETAGSGWSGAGMILNIDGGFTRIDEDEEGNEVEVPLSVEATSYGTAKELGDKTLGTTWQTDTWARGITIPFLNLNLTAEYKALTEFTLRVGTRSGAHKYWMDNVTLVERTAAHGEIISQPAETTSVMEGRVNGVLSVIVNELVEGGEITYQWYQNETESNEGGTAVTGATEATFSIPVDLKEGTYYFYCEVFVDEEMSDVSNLATVIVEASSDCIFSDNFEDHAEVHFTYDLTSHPKYNDLITGLTDKRDEMTYLQYVIQIWDAYNDLDLVNAWFVAPDPTEAEPERTKRLLLGDYTWISGGNPNGQRGWELYEKDDDDELIHEDILEGIADGTITDFVIAFTAESVEGHGGMNGLSFILNTNATGWSQQDNYFSWGGWIGMDDLYELAEESDDVTFVENLKYATNNGWNSWSNATQIRELSKRGEGYGSGYAMKYTTTERKTNNYDHQLAYELPNLLENGGDFKYSFWVRADIADVANNNPEIAGEVQGLPGYANTGGFTPFTLTDEWQFVEIKITVNRAASIERQRPLFNFGHFVGTAYFDDVNFCYTGPIVRITTQPVASTTVSEGVIEGSLKIVASITQGATLSYQWYKNTTNSNKGGTAVSGATEAEFEIPEDLTIGMYYFYCVVSGTDDAESVTSNVATVEVLCPTCPVITITKQPESGTVQGGGSLTVEATATLDATLSYQWYSNTSNSNIGGTAIEDATDAEFTIPSKVGTYYFYCVVNASGEESNAEPKASNVATITVEAVIEITTQPANANVNFGNAASLTVVAKVTEGATLSYQWYINTTNSNEGGTTLSGATNGSYSTSTVLAAGTYYYYCIVSATHGAEDVTTNIATVVISPQTGVSEIFGADFKVYPNPFDGVIRIEAAEGATLFVVNSAGSTVHVQKITNTNETINLENLPAGLYVLRLEKDKQAIAVTVIKK